MKTRAAIHVGQNAPQVVDELDLPDPGPNHVTVSLFASGICHSQLHQIHNPNQPTPSVLGHEATGVVTGAGSGVDYVKEGDRVMVTWLTRTPSPGQRPAAASGWAYRGQPVNFGLGGTATWTESTVVHEQYVVKLPDLVDEQLTSIIGCAVMTGAGAALNTGRVRAGDSVAVFGVGGVGLSCVQACANAGAYPIIVVDLRDDKLAFASQFGATHFVNASIEDPVARIRELTGGVGVDCSFDAIGAPKTLEQFYQVVRTGANGISEPGTAVLIGVPTGPTQFQMGQMWNRRLTGSFGGGGRPERDFPMYVRWFQEGKLPLDKLVSRRYRLEQINDALGDLERGDIAGRSIIVF
ncbi:MAG: zinc-binding dehydrogenase [Chloroflexi bacterium]|nr:zinc-binding dehydrogenase [Chloroflexota bacterium]